MPVTDSPAQEASIRLSGVHYGYTEGGQRHEVLHGLALAIAAGECVALHGRSGSGKSSLLNLIGGLARADAGELCVAGRDLRRLDERSRTLLRRRRIGIVYQFFNLIDTLSVIDNVLLPLDLDGRADAAGCERAEALLDAVGLADRRSTRPDRLSGGERQRVALARALVHEPAIVLADEPTGNLDAENGARIVELLNTLVRGAGHTLLMVTHDETIAGWADRVVHLADGQILGSG